MKIQESYIQNYVFINQSLVAKKYKEIQKNTKDKDKKTQGVDLYA